MESNGTTYNDATLARVVEILEVARTHCPRVRLRFWYGDAETGRAWGDVETGYIGRSMGPVKIPLCIHNRRSRGGPGLLEQCIVKIECAAKRNRGSYLDWQHPTFHV